jgi:hypothetical protein
MAQGLIGSKVATPPVVPGKRCQRREDAADISSKTNPQRRVGDMAGPAAGLVPVENEPKQTFSLIGFRD